MVLCGFACRTSETLEHFPTIQTQGILRVFCTCLKIYILGSCFQLWTWMTDMRKSPSRHPPPGKIHTAKTQHSSSSHTPARGSILCWWVVNGANKRQINRDQDTHCGEEWVWIHREQPRLHSLPRRNDSEKLIWVQSRGVISVAGDLKLPHLVILPLV